MKSCAGFCTGMALAAMATAQAQAPPRFVQHIGEQLPMAAGLVDESGSPVRLGSFFGSRPVLLIFGYFTCPQLCSVLERSAIDTLRDLKPGVGRNFDLIYLSIDPSDSAAEARRKRGEAVREYGRGTSVAGWHYLTGPEVSVRQVADAAGFGYRYDRRSRLYRHPSGYVVATPQGRVSRYFLGVDIPARAAAEAFRRAAAEKTGEPVFDLLIECFHGDNFAGPYGPLIWRTLEAAVALTLAAVAGGIGWMLWQESTGRRRVSEAAP